MEARKVEKITEEGMNIDESKDEDKKKVSVECEGMRK
jgi:hypothetical protein